MYVLYIRKNFLSKKYAFSDEKALIIGYEWIIIAVVVIVFLIWGPSKIVEFARAIGKAKKEYNREKEVETKEKD